MIGLNTCALWANRYSLHWNTRYGCRQGFHSFIPHYFTTCFSSWYVFNLHSELFSVKFYFNTYLGMTCNLVSAVYRPIPGSFFFKRFSFLFFNFSISFFLLHQRVTNMNWHDDKANQFINRAFSSYNILIFGLGLSRPRYIAAVLQIAWYFVSLDYPPFFHEFAERERSLIMSDFRGEGGSKMTPKNRTSKGNNRTLGGEGG